MASVTQSAPAISRLVRPSARRTRTSRSRDGQDGGGPVVEGREPDGSGERPVQPGDDVPVAFARRVDDHAELVGVDRPQRDARDAECEEIAHLMFVRRWQQHDDLRVRAQPHEPPNDVGHFEIGRRADDDEHRLLQGREPDELATRPGLGDDVDPPRLEHSSDAGAHEGELVGDDRRGHVQRHHTPPSGRDPATLPSTLAHTTQSGRFFQP